jgi:ubiquinone/menaquinone biosynthesis C-methylase UbiE
MTVVLSQAELAKIKARQQQTWASGDFSMIGARIVLVAERLADACDLRAGWNVLDIATGNGNAAIAAARSGVHAVGVDYVGALLEDGRSRSVAEGLDVEFLLGDSEDLPVANAAFDATLSVFGTMFAPDSQRSADEVLRVTRPGGTVGLASWTPDGFVGEMFTMIHSHVPGPSGLQSPMLWGTQAHLDQLFGESVAQSRHEQHTCTFRFASAPEFVGFFRRWFGPTLKAFEALDDTGRAALGADLTDLADRHDRHHDGGGIAIDATYLQSVLTLR